MERLRSRDLRSLLEFLRDTYALRDPDAFAAHVVASIGTVVASDNSGYTDMDLRRRTAKASIAPDGWTVPAQQAFQRHMHEHPLVHHYRRTGDPRPYQISDFLTRRQFHRLALYNEFVRPFFGTEAQIAFTVSASPSRVVGVSLGRQRTDFSERDRLLLGLLRPHLLQAFANARAVGGMAEELSRLRRGVEALDRGVVFVGPDARMLLATSLARAQLAAYFGRARRPDRLPERVRSWLDAQRAALAAAGEAPPPRAPLVVEGADGTLTVRLASGPLEDVLLLEERRTLRPAALEPLGLTHREAEVLAWVALGKTSAETASLVGARVRTVEKHLERIFLKLGVENRTAAADRVRELL